MRGLADGRVVHVQVAADRAHNDLSRVEADTDLDFQPVRPPRVVRVPLQRVLHPQRRVTRPHRMLLVRERRAEERHDSIAHHLVDGTLVPVDGLHHQLEDRVENLARLLRIPVGQQLHRALEVGEEDGDLLALALKRGLGGEDLLGQMLWRVGLRRDEARRRAGGAHRRGALEAEPRPGGELRPAARAPESKRRRALQAEPRPWRILLLASGTLHADPPVNRAGQTARRG